MFTILSSRCRLRMINRSNEPPQSPPATDIHPIRVPFFALCISASMHPAQNPLDLFSTSRDNCFRRVPDTPCLLFAKSLTRFSSCGHSSNFPSRSRVFFPALESGIKLGDGQKPKLEARSCFVIGDAAGWKRPTRYTTRAE